jgi:multiple sugar transport system substrate-binding protein
MNQKPERMARRKFIYAGLGALVVILAGTTAYFATRPPQVIEKTVKETVTKTITATVEKPVTTTVSPTTTPALVLKGPFTYWHEKGYTESEDKAWNEIVKTFADKYGIKDYELVLPPVRDFPVKLQAAVDAGTPPDVALSPHFLRTRYAFEGKLVDLTDIIEPVKDKLAKIAVEGGYLYDKTIGRKSYYSGQCFATGYFLHVNKDLIRKAGEDPENIPKEWDEFHGFFRRIQKKLGGPPPYAFGYPQSTQSRGDGPNMVEQLFVTMGGEIVSKDNELIIDDDNNKEIFIRTIDILTSFIKEGYCPKDALTWDPPANNVAFNTGITVIMWNGTLSIPMYWLNKDPKKYYESIATIDAPTGPNGEEWTYGMAGTGHETWKNSKNIDAAKKFIAYMLEPEPQVKVVKTMLGRYYPTRKEAAEDPEIKKGFATAEYPVDPNYPAYYRQLFERKNFVLWEFSNPALGEMVTAGCLTDPCARVVVDGLTPKEAVEEQIPRMKSIWKKYYG